jgi:hypothetical protein
MLNDETQTDLFQDHLLSDEIRGRIHDFSLDARDLLTQEARELLESTYGLHADGTFEAPSHLPALADPETRTTYDRLKQFLAAETRAGLERREAIDKLVKEVAFTHLHRLVAFKMMEVRKIIREAVGRGHDSNGFKFYLADHPGELALFNAGSADEAYRHFLLWQAGEIAQEVRVLFDPDDLPSRLFPRPVALRELLRKLNSPELALAWQADETIGWIYQFFNEREKAEVFDRLFNQKKKIRREDIGPATQLFTPRWIVRFIIENTLGRLWVQMHPDSGLKDKLHYLVPPAGEIPHVALRPVKEITLLDPASGTMHFGLVAFDLFAEMYREEMHHAGEPGWMAEPSVKSEDEIAAAIIQHNLFGIDIDLRAVQLSALSLFLKAKSLNKNANITVSNLACADILPGSQDHLKQFLKKVRYQNKAFERILLDVWDQLQDMNQLGSLIRLEQAVTTSVRKYGDLYMWGTKARPGTREEEAEYWTIVESQVLGALDDFAKYLAESGLEERFFVGETTKALRVMDVMLRRYDVVVTNPPYMDSGNMNDTLSLFLSDSYSKEKGDLYSAFIRRCAEFARNEGHLGMITQQSFMFIATYENLRTALLKEFAFEALVHTGAHAFAEISGEKVNTVIFVGRREPDLSRCNANLMMCFRLVHEKHWDRKRLLFEDSLQAKRANKAAPAVYVIQQSQIHEIPGSPWAYWVSSPIRNLFRELPSLGDKGQPRQGLATADNFRFLRAWWEVGRKPISYRAGDREQARISGARWFPIIKGANSRRWYNSESDVVNWWNDGLEIRSFYAPSGRLASRPQNMDYYFRQGLALIRVGPSGFSARFNPGSHIFDSSLSGIFDLAIDQISELSGVINSSFALYLLSCLNPTINFQAGDLARLPIPVAGSDTLRGLVELVIRMVSAIRRRDETAHDFIMPPFWHTGLAHLADVSKHISCLEKTIDDEVYRLYNIPTYERASITAELNGVMAIAEEDPGDDRQEQFSEEEKGDAKAAASREELAVRWISYAIGVAFGHFHPGIAGELGSAIYRRSDFAIGSLPEPSEEEFNELVGAPNHFAYVDGKGWRHVFSINAERALKRLAVSDGITVLEEGHERDLPGRVSNALELMLGADAAQEIINEGAGGDLRGFLEQDFFTRWHLKWYHKRPVYWYLQSGRRSYGFVLFHEPINADTFYAIQRQPYLDTRRQAVRLALADLLANIDNAGKQRRQIERERDGLLTLQQELDEFAEALEAITSAGYKPAANWIDDGVILRMAPLWSVIPLWKTEPKKYWDKLAAGDFDWSHIAMQYWPKRVREKCRKNKSFAIAHDLEELYQGD